MLMWRRGVPAYLAPNADATDWRTWAMNSALEHDETMGDDAHEWVLITPWCTYAAAIRPVDDYTTVAHAILDGLAAAGVIDRKRVGLMIRPCRVSDAHQLVVRVLSSRLVRTHLAK